MNITSFFYFSKNYVYKCYYFENIIFYNKNFDFIFISILFMLKLL